MPELRWQLERLGVTGAGRRDARGRDPRPARALEDPEGNGRGEPVFLRGAGDYEEKAARKHLTPETAPILEQARAALAGLSELGATAIHGAIQGLAESGGFGLGKVAQPIRVAVSGGSVSPPIDQTLAILGREETLGRIDRALAYARRLTGNRSRLTASSRR